MDRNGRENMGESSRTETAPVPSKRPYSAPKLRHIGSVRELTLGTSMGAFGDGGTGMMVTLM
jgi:hypothetical protein